MQNCSFCGKTQKEVFKLLEGIDGVHICDSCVDLSTQLLDKERVKTYNTLEASLQYSSYHEKE